MLLMKFCGVVIVAPHREQELLKNMEAVKVCEAERPGKEV
jgi:hypothetical protein